MQTNSANATRPDASIGAPPNMSYSQAAGGGATRRAAIPKPRLIPFLFDLPCTVTIETRDILPRPAVVQALKSAFPDDEEMALEQKEGYYFIQFATNEEAKLASQNQITIGNISYALRSLHSSSKEQLFELQITNATTSANRESILAEALSPYGTVVKTVFNKTDGFFDHSAYVLFHVNEKKSLPPRTVKVTGDDFQFDMHVSPIGRPQFCFYCRETSHRRSNCPVAPACFKCGQRSHHGRHCKIFTPSPKKNNEPKQSQGNKPSSSSSTVPPKVTIFTGPASAQVSPTPTTPIRSSLVRLPSLTTPMPRLELNTAQGSSLSPLARSQTSSPSRGRAAIAGLKGRSVTQSPRKRVRQVSKSSVDDQLAQYSPIALAGPTTDGSGAGKDQNQDTAQELPEKNTTDASQKSSITAPSQEKEVSSY